MKIGKIELIKENLIIAISIASLVIALAVYVIFYAPLMRELKKEYRECKVLEGEVLEMRNVIDSAGNVREQRAFITEEEVYQAIDELTKHGESKGVEFISISPKEIIDVKGEEYKILPVEMAVESTYEKMGVLLGSLDDLEKGLVRVKSFEITPDLKNPSKFITDLVVEIYLLKGKK